MFYSRLSVIFSMVSNGATAIEMANATSYPVNTVRARIADLRSNGIKIDYNEITKQYTRG